MRDMSKLDPEATRVRVFCPRLGEREEFAEGLQALWASRLITLGRYCERLEEEATKYLGVKHAVAVGNCTSGLMLCMKALGMQGEVILPSYTFTATAHAAVWAGLEPVFADCEPLTWTIDPAKVEEAITPLTGGIVAVSIFGVPPRYCELEQLSQKRGIPLLTDSAQAIGSEYWEKKAGGFGDAEVFSMSPTKVVTAGEGGLVTTNDDKVAEYVRQGRDYGKNGSDVDFIGLSARMSEFHALLGLRNLQALEQSLTRRFSLIERYKRRLKGLPGIRFQHVPHGCRSSTNYFVVHVDAEKCPVSRDELHSRLAEMGIETKRYFWPPVHLLKAYRQYRDKYEGRLPVTEKVAASTLAFPLFTEMQDEQVDRVCDATEGILREAGLNRRAVEAKGEVRS
jgi:dTDP-4-amino-4,6-dideoxygalactose transaminase